MAMTKPTSEQVTFLQTGTGASARTVDSKLKDSVDIRDYGAVDGIGVDNTTPLNNAYAAAKANKCRLNIPVGIWRFTSQLLWNQGVDVCGAHHEYCVLLKDGAFDGIKITDTGANISGFYVKGHTANTGAGIVLIGTNYNDIHDIQVSYHGGVGIKYDYTSTANSAISFVTLRRATISSNGAGGILLDGTGAASPIEYCNVCSFHDLSIQSNTGVGFNQIGQNTSGYHAGSNIVIENNTGGGMNLCGIQSTFNSVYTESNTGYDLNLDTTTTRNYVDLVNKTITPFDRGTDNTVRDGLFLSAKYITPLPKYTIAGSGSTQTISGGHSSTVGNNNGGDLTLAGGNASGTGRIGYVILSTGQLQFPVTQAPTTEANTLDDYEEGSWSPVMTSTGATFTYSSEGKYQKVGDRVTVTGYFATSGVATGTTTNAFSVTGLPFTSAAFTNGFPVVIANPTNIDWIVGALQLVGVVPTSSTSIVFSWATASNVTQLLASAVDNNGTVLSFTCKYQTTQ